LLHAIFETGGKQYRVAEGDILYIERLPVQAGDKVTFDKVLAIVDGDKFQFGTPVLDGATVTASIVKNGKAKKIHVFKFKAKKNYRKRQGHRQPYSQVQIQSISAGTTA
jgi:large subunit ribosomal protein L21